MKTLIYGAGPIGQWLALRLQNAGSDVTLLARGRTFEQLDRDGIVIVDGLTDERMTARVPLVQRLEPEDGFDLVVVAMQRSSRIAICPTLARNRHVKSFLFLGNDIDGFHRYLDLLPKHKVLFGFPGAGGGWRDNELVVMDREDASGPFGEVYLGELDGVKGRRTWLIGRLFSSAGIKVNYENDIDGWLKYHFAFMAPTAGIIMEKGGDLKAVAKDKNAIHRYCRACREAGNVLSRAGYRQRQPAIFNLYYWLPRWLEPVVFGKLFGSVASEIRFGLHAKTVGPELLELAEEFRSLTMHTALTTPTLNELVERVRWYDSVVRAEEVA
jgi:2-dehydropantoate 2-reductase